jgi:hypothetical protein
MIQLNQGLTWEDKVNQIKSDLERNSANYFSVTALDEVACEKKLLFWMPYLPLLVK